MSVHTRANALPAEGLDGTLRLVSRGERLQIAGAALLIGLALAGSLWIKVSTTVAGAGVVLWSDGITTAMSRYEGEIAEMPVREGDFVEAGEPVATLRQTGIELDLTLARARLERLQQRLVQTESIFADQSAREISVRARESQALQARQTRSAELLKLLEVRLENELALRSRGMASENQILATRTEVSRTRNELAQIGVNLARLPREEMDAAASRERVLMDMRAEVDAAELQIEALRTRLAEMTNVLAPVSGHVVEITARVGHTAAAREPVLRIAESNREGPAAVLAYLYVPAGEGKKVHPDMPVLLSPASAERERYGYALGTVRTVAHLPASSAGFAALAGQPELLQRVSQGGPPLQVTVELTVDPSTPSGLRWTGSRGPTFKLEPGTFFSGEVVIERRPLLLVLFPFLQPRRFGELVDGLSG
jgi:HlyD family secretion protein